MSKENWKQLALFLFLSTVWFVSGWEAHSRLTPAVPAELERVAKAGQAILTRTYPSAPIQAEELANAAIRGMLRLTEDRYVALYVGQAAERFHADFAGETGAPGLWYEYQNGQFIITSLRAGGAAATAGVQVGDIILGVDDLTVNALTTGHEIAMLLRGPLGVAVPLTVQRGTTTLTFQVQRETREQLSSRLLPQGYGYVRLPSFPAGIAQALKAKLVALQAQGMQGLILDMRGNAGGSTHDAAEILDFFIKEGTLYTAEFKGGKHLTFRAKGDAFLADLPLVVLVDDGSYSSTELVTAALVDHGRAQVIGSTTGGKGTIQETIPLDEQALLHLTIAKWLSPAGHWVQHQGIQPDVAMVDDPTTPADEVLDLAVAQVQGITAVASNTIAR